jgi:hypothetical protein
VCLIAAAVLWTLSPKEKAPAVKKEFIAGFYHMYSPSDSPFPRALYEEHLRDIAQSVVFKETAKMFVVLVGTDLTAAKALLAGAKKVSVLSELTSGDEGATLVELWRHCKSSRSRFVWYMHGKGSFHPSETQDLWRRLLTRDVLSAGCLRELRNGRDVCGMRFSPAPHAHFPGNFWIARCDYVARLPDPRAERGTLCVPRGSGAERYRLAPKGGCNFASNLGAGRYRFEHWIAIGHGNFSDCLEMQHPTPKVKPYVFGGVPPLTLAEFPRRCAAAPRPGVMKAIAGFAGVAEQNEKFDRALMSGKSGLVDSSTAGG